MTLKDPEHVTVGGGASDKGFALVVVIWIGVLLALIAAAFTSSVRSRIRATASQSATVRGEAFADAGVRLAMLDLLNVPTASTKPQRFVPGGTPVLCAIGADASLAIAIEDEDGKINLNTQNGDLLMALFAGLGASQSDARRYADRVMDFRDSDDDKRADGAERAEYPAGREAGPKNANFASADELDQVLGIPAGIRDLAKRYLTTASVQDGFDPTTAPEALKALIVRGAGGIVVSQSDRPLSDGITISSDLPLGFAATSRRQAYAIHSEALLASGGRFVSEAIVTLPDGPDGVPLLHRWRRGASILPEGKAIPPPQQLPPC